jgi:hypothetical protein
MATETGEEEEEEAVQATTLRVTLIQIAQYLFRLGSDVGLLDPRPGSAFGTLECLRSAMRKAAPSVDEWLPSDLELVEPGTRLGTLGVYRAIVEQLLVHEVRLVTVLPDAMRNMASCHYASNVAPNLHTLNVTVRDTFKGVADTEAKPVVRTIGSLRRVTPTTAPTRSKTTRVPWTTEFARPVVSQLFGFGGDAAGAETKTAEPCALTLLTVAIAHLLCDNFGGVLCVSDLMQSVVGADDVVTWRAIGGMPAPDRLDLRAAKTADATTRGELAHCVWQWLEFASDRRKETTTQVVHPTQFACDLLDALVCELGAVPRNLGWLPRDWDWNPDQTERVELDVKTFTTCAQCDP